MKRYLPIRPPEGQRCTNPGGCDRTALPGRYVCEEHAEALERRGAELRAAGEASPRGHRAEFLEKKERRERLG